MSFLSKEFFDLSSSILSSLFSAEEPVWTALDRIQAFLKQADLGQHESELLQGVYLPFPEQVFVGKGCHIEPGAYLEGPCYIGEGCVVRHGAYIRSNVILAPKSVVGHASEVKGSIFLEGAKAPHFNYVGDSILGANVNLGAGVKCANLRLDRQEIVVKVGSEAVSTGRRKLGAILGDGCQLGCNSVTNPGTLCVPGTVCSPCTSLKGYCKQGACSETKTHT